VSEGGNVVKTFSYSYDPASNRLTEQVDATTRQFAYNAFNALTSVEGDASLAATYQWDAEHRLISVTSGNQNTQFTYDGLGRRVGIRLLVNGAEVSDRRFVWCDDEICEERTPLGIVSKRFFRQGMKVEGGATAGAYFYSRDHLGSIREMTDSGGNIRARYSYDPFGRRTRLTGDVDADFGFAAMFWSSDIGINMTKFRVYDANLGRWLSRDPLVDAEVSQGVNLYAYVGNDPVNLSDPTGRFAAVLVAGLGITAADVIFNLGLLALAIEILTPDEGYRKPGERPDYPPPPPVFPPPPGQPWGPRPGDWPPYEPWPPDYNPPTPPGAPRLDRCYRA
jgi:RHS repeat-associated protein